MTIPVKVDILEKGNDRLLYQYKDQSNIVALLNSYLKQLDKTQEDTFHILDNYNVYTAVGTSLDYIGELVGVARTSSLDEEYRKEILRQIFINNSEGTPKSVLTLLKALSEGSDVRLFEHYPCNIHLYTNGGAELQRVVDIIKSAVPVSCSAVTIMDSPSGGAFTPCELAPETSETGTLGSVGGNTIVTAGGDTISLVAYSRAYDSDLAILAEILPSDLLTFNGTSLENLQVDNGTIIENLMVTGVDSEFNSAPYFSEIYT